MSYHIVKIIEKEKVNYNTFRFVTEKPDNYEYKSGQAVSLSVNSPELKDKKRPFTFVSIPSDNHLEFAIKEYSDGEVTPRLGELNIGDTLSLRNIYGNLKYNGPGLFLAGGTGITPFLSIFRYLNNIKSRDKNYLIYSIKTYDDLLFENQLLKLLKNNVKITLSQENKKDYNQGRITRELLKDNTNYENYYICGPVNFVINTKKILDDLEIMPEKIIKEF